MAKNEEVLEELYELLTLYFEFSTGGDFIKSSDPPKKTELALDRVIFKDLLFAKISDTVMKLMV